MAKAKPTITPIDEARAGKLLAALKGSETISGALAAWSGGQDEFIKYLQWCWDAATVGVASRDEEVQKLSARLNLMYRDGMAVGNIKDALQATKELARMLNLHNPILRGKPIGNRLSEIKAAQANAK